MLNCMRWPNYNFFKLFRSDSTVIQLNKVHMLDVISVHFKLNTILPHKYVNNEHVEYYYEHPQIL